MRERAGHVEAQTMPLDSELLEQLALWSKGYQILEVASLTNLSSSQIKDRRKQLRQAIAPGQGRYIVVQAIQNGQLPIEVSEAKEGVDLSPAEEVVLRLAALGYDDEAIAKRRGSSRHTVNSLEGTLCNKLGARSMTHAMRRAFELGKFNIGEPILDPDEQLDIDHNRYRIVVDGTVRRLGDLGLRNMREIELISLFRKLDRGFFDIKKMYDLGFFEDAPNSQSRAQTFGRSASHVSSRLADSFNGSIIDARKIRGEDGRYVRYMFLRPLGIGPADDLHIVPQFNINDITHMYPGRQVGATVRRRTTHKRKVNPLKNKPEKEPPLPTEVARPEVSLPAVEAGDLTDEFLATLVGRDPSEVANNPTARAVAVNILKENNLPYGTKFMMALRYGIKLHPRYEPLFITRNGIRRSLNEILQNTPDFRGLDITSVSKILNEHPFHLLSLEQKLLQPYGQKNVLIAELIKKLEAQKQETLEKDSTEGS